MSNDYESPHESDGREHDDWSDDGNNNLDQDTGFSLDNSNYDIEELLQCTGDERVERATGSVQSDQFSTGGPFRNLNDQFDDVIHGQQGLVIGGEFGVQTLDEEVLGGAQQGQAGERVQPWMEADIVTTRTTETHGGGTENRFLAAFSDNAVGDFLENYFAMREASVKGADRYFHCVANCEAASRGARGTATAYAISYGREAIDAVKHLLQGISMKESITDIQQDMEANKTGIKFGRAGLRCIDACARYRPNGL